MAVSGMTSIGGVEEVGVFSEQFWKVPKVPESRMEAGILFQVAGNYQVV